MTSTLVTLTGNTFGAAFQIGSSGRLSVIVRSSSVFDGAKVVIEKSGNNTNYGRAGSIEESDKDKTRVVSGIVGEYVKVGAENSRTSTSLLVDIVTD